MQPLTKQTLKIFWQHARRYTWQPYVLFIMTVLVTVFRDISPVYYKKLIDVISKNPDDQILAKAIGILFIILIFNFARQATWRASMFLNNFFQNRVMGDLVRTCYEYLQQHSIGFFNSNFIGSLVTKVKRYERSYEILSDQFFYNFGRTLIELVIIVSILFWRLWILGAIMLGWSLFYILIAYLISMYKLPYDIKRAKADTETTAQLADTLTNNFNIKIFSNYVLEFKRFAKVVDSQFRARKKSADLGTTGEIFQGVYMLILEFGLMYAAVRYRQAGVLTVGDIVLVQVYILRIFDQLWDTGKNIRVIYEAVADVNEMTEMLVQPQEVEDRANAQNLKVKKGEIIFRDVNFGYHKDMEVLSDFNLPIAAGESLALIGPSGGGKSTIIKLLLRFYDLQSGQIAIDGQDIGKVTQNSLRASMAFVPQDPILFHRSLMDNIRYARPQASNEEVIESAKLAHAHAFISSFPEGYNTFVGERGIKLSGGERQRVAIARAILKNAPILVFDEATSSLDSESEYLIQDALKNLMKDKTTIVIAHRLSTIMKMDRIVVIDGGRIIEEGEHGELLKAKQGTYQRLWNIQAGGFAPL